MATQPTARSLEGVMSRSVTDQIERALFAQAELNYMSGATALVRMEIALTQRAMYHKPGFNRNWAWDHRTEARIRGLLGKPAQQYDWDEVTESRRDADADEEDQLALRDTGSHTLLTLIPAEDPKPAPVVAGHIGHTRKDLIDA